MMDNATAILERSILFSGLEPDTLRKIAEQVVIIQLQDGDTVFVEDEPGDSLYIVGDGEVAILKRMGSGERELARLKAGNHFGEMSLITEAPRTATVRATEHTTCLKLDQKGFGSLMMEDARFSQRILKELTTRLKETDEASTRQMLQAHQALSFSLAKLADSRDPETGAHLFRTREYCTLLSQLLSDHPKFRHVITESFIENMYLVAPLHDIGKVAIQDGILLKQGKLTDAEFEIMSTHTLLGAEAIDTVLEYCDFEVFHMARRVILYHHERYDGKGYPHKIKGEDIPIEARVMTLADIYDALLSKRVYKPAFGYDEARNRIADSSGQRFDPEMTEVMISNIDKFEEIHRNYTKTKEPDDD